MTLMGDQLVSTHRCPLDAWSWYVERSPWRGLEVDANGGSQIRPVRHAASVKESAAGDRKLRHVVTVDHTAGDSEPLDASCIKLGHPSREAFSMCRSTRLMVIDGLMRYLPPVFRHSERLFPVIPSVSRNLGLDIQHAAAKPLPLPRSWGDACSTSERAGGKPRFPSAALSACPELAEWGRRSRRSE